MNHCVAILFSFLICNTYFATFHQNLTFFFLLTLPCFYDEFTSSQLTHSLTHSGHTTYERMNSPDLIHNRLEKGFDIGDGDEMRFCIDFGLGWLAGWLAHLLWSNEIHV